MDGFVVGDWPEIPDKELERMCKKLLDEITKEEILSIPTVRETLEDVLFYRAMAAWEEAQSLRAEFDSMKRGEEL